MICVLMAGWGRLGRSVQAKGQKICARAPEVQLCILMLGGDKRLNTGYTCPLGEVEGQRDGGVEWWSCFPLLPPVQSYYARGLWPW